MNRQESLMRAFGRRWPEVRSPKFHLGWPYFVILVAALLFSSAKVSSNYSEKGANHDGYRTHLAYASR